MLVRQNAGACGLAAAPAAVPGELLPGGVLAAEEPFALGAGALKRAGVGPGKAAAAVQQCPRQIGCLAAYRRAAGKFAGERSARGEREHALAVRHAGDERAGVRSVLHAPEERGAAGNIFPLTGEKALGGERSLKPPAVAQHGAGISALGKRAGEYCGFLREGERERLIRQLLRAAGEQEKREQRRKEKKSFFHVLSFQPGSSSPARERGSMSSVAENS